MTFLVAVGGAVSPRRPGAVVRTSICCGSCGAPIGAGEVYALVTDAGLKRCGDCAVAMTYADWDARGVCPWPLRMAVDDPVAPDTVNFEALLRAAVERGRAPRAA